MFIKVIKWSMHPFLKKENTPTQVFHVDSYEVSGVKEKNEEEAVEENGETKVIDTIEKAVELDNSGCMKFDIVLISGRTVSLSLPKKETLKEMRESDVDLEEWENTKSISVYVTNDEGKTIQSYNL